MSVFTIGQSTIGGPDTLGGVFTAATGTVTITAPDDGATVDASVTVIATTTGDVATVRFTLGDLDPVEVAVVDNAASATFDVSGLDGGAVTVTAQAIAADGTTVLDSESLTITVEHPRLALLVGGLHVGLGLGL